MQVLYLLTGWEGSVNDSFLYSDAHINDLHVPPGYFHPRDAGFPLCNSVLVSYCGIHYHLQEWGWACQQWFSHPVILHKAFYLTTASNPQATKQRGAFQSMSFTSTESLSGSLVFSRSDGPFLSSCQNVIWDCKHGLLQHWQHFITLYLTKITLDWAYVNKEVYDPSPGGASQSQGNVSVTGNTCRYSPHRGGIRGSHGQGMYVCEMNVCLISEHND